MRGIWPLRRVFVSASLLALLLAAALGALGALAFDVRISQARLNQAIAAKLPFARKAGPVSWRLESAEMTVLEQGRIGFEGKLQAEAAGHEAHIHVAGASGLTYRDGAFWLSGFRVDKVDELSFGAQPAEGGVRKALGALVERSATARQAIDATIAKALDHANEVLDAVFEAVPVYRLKDDWRGSAARMVLVSVRTDGQDLVARVDPLGRAVRAMATIVALLTLAYLALCVVARLSGLFRFLLFWW